MHRHVNLRENQVGADEEKLCGVDLRFGDSGADGAWVRLRSHRIQGTKGPILGGNFCQKEKWRVPGAGAMQEAIKDVLFLLGISGRDSICLPRRGSGQSQPHWGLPARKTWPQLGDREHGANHCLLTLAAAGRPQEPVLAPERHTLWH